MRSDQIRKAFEAHDLGQFAEGVLATARPALRLRTCYDELEDPPLGESRMGGDPDLPAGMPWPENKGRPLAFVAQTDLAAAAGVCALPGLPTSGWICAFCDLEAFHETWDEDSRTWQLKYLEGEAASLRRTPHPGEPLEKFDLHEIQFEPEDRVPDVTDFVTGIPDDEAWDICEWLNEAINDSFDSNPVHRLGGYPFLIQGPHTVEEAQGRSFLLQIASDHDVGCLWGDMGCVYFWIAPGDLKARRFERAWVTFDSY